MSTQALRKLAMLVRDLLEQEEGSVVVLGRTNMRRDDFSALQIVVDQLGPSQVVAAGARYDGGAEVMQHQQTWKMLATVDFHGDGAGDESERFCLLLQSETALNLKRELEIAVYRPTAIRNLKHLTDEQFSEHLQVELMVQHNVTADEDVLYIETPILEVRADGAGIIYED
jgi:hypothetical protein